MNLFIFWFLIIHVLYMTCPLNICLCTQKQKSLNTFSLQYCICQHMFQFMFLQSLQHSHISLSCSSCLSLCLWFMFNSTCSVGQDSVVCIATGYGLDGPGIEFWCREIFHTCPDRPWGPLSLLFCAG
jgi:ABC-type uncharacterized transport system permease subunit